MTILFEPRYRIGHKVKSKIDVDAIFIVIGYVILAVNNSGEVITYTHRVSDALGHEYAFYDYEIEAA